MVKDAPYESNVYSELELGSSTKILDMLHWMAGNYEVIE